MPVGAGEFDLNAFATGDESAGMFGGQLEYRHRLSPSWSTFVSGSAWYEYGATTTFGYEAQFGLRGRW